MKANAFMWTALGAMYGFDGMPWHAVAAYLALCVTDRVLNAVR